MVLTRQRDRDQDDSIWARFEAKSMIERLQREIEQEDGGVEKHRFVFWLIFVVLYNAVISKQA